MNLSFSGATQWPNKTLKVIFSLGVLYCVVFIKALFSPVMILQVCKKMCNGEWLFTKLAYVSCSGERLEVGARCVLPITTKSYSRLKKCIFSSNKKAREHYHRPFFISSDFIISSYFLLCLSVTSNNVILLTYGTHMLKLPAY